MTTRYFKVIHKAGAFIDGIHYPCADDQNDITDSIVPLELKKGDKTPLWGVEVDTHGNEIGERPDPYSVQDTIGNKLADNIAKNAGVGANAQKTGHTGVDTPNRNQDENREDGSNKNGLQANGTKAEAEQRKATIVETLGLLDHDKDDDWTTGGLPKVEVVASASGLEGLTRDEITAAQPDFKREVKA